MISEELIRVERSLRYALRVANDRTATLVYLLHGYGQLAEYFIRKVAHVLPDTVTLVAPEGMHRFYLEGTSGRVGASWMTKAARELDILENTQSLDRLHQQLLARFRPDKVLVLGFSQGGATATRWIANGTIAANGFVSWASVFPPDIATETGFRFETMKKWFVLGTEDPYFSADSARETSTFYAENGFEVIRFTGTHTLDAHILEQLIHAL